MHDDVVAADRLGVAGEFDDNVEVLIRAGQHGLRLAGRLLDRDVEQTLALGQRQRKELALFAGDEQTVNRKIVDPVPHVCAQAGLVERKIARPKRRIGGGEDAAHVHAGVVLGLVLAVFHRAPSVLAW